MDQHLVYKLSWAWARMRSEAWLCSRFKMVSHTIRLSNKQEGTRFQ